MKVHGIDIEIKNKPRFDRNFAPLYAFNQKYLVGATIPVELALRRNDGVEVTKTFIRGDAEADAYYLERLVKTMLWVKGGYKLYVKGELAFRHIASAFSKTGSRKFDVEFMSDVYEKPFEVVKVDTLPPASSKKKAIGGNLSGSRIGLDLGGSDRKVSAVVDGTPVFSEEVVWLPKVNSDPEYHYNGIVSALKSAASHLKHVDGVGVSSAGIFIGNRTMKASLFLAVPKEQFDRKVKDIYIRAITDTFGNVPFAVVNDGDVSALAGAMSIGDGSVLGIAMGTSEAGGFVDGDGLITGWLNELAFVPVDAGGAVDEWSGDVGCGVKYFSQDGVIKLAENAGIPLVGTPAEKLKIVQSLVISGDAKAIDVFKDIGIYLGHTLPFYHDIYGNRHVLLLGRVMSGTGGELILSEAKRVMSEEYNLDLDVRLPDERFRRVGQAQAAASLPKIE